MTTSGYGYIFNYSIVVICLIFIIFYLKKKMPILRESIEGLKELKLKQKRLEYEYELFKLRVEKYNKRKEKVNKIKMLKYKRF